MTTPLEALREGIELSARIERCQREENEAALRAARRKLMARRVSEHRRRQRLEREGRKTC